MGAATRNTPLIGTVSRLALAVVVAASLAACSWNEQRTETLGGVVGGIVGGILGSKVGGGTGKTSATIVGATLGAMLGQDVAKGMTDVDKLFHERTTADTLEYGEPGENVSWSNPDTGNSGTVTAGDTYQNADGTACRTFETTVTVEGEARTTEGKACRQPDGTWAVVEDAV